MNTFERPYAPSKLSKKPVEEFEPSVTSDLQPPSYLDSHLEPKKRSLRMLSELVKDKRAVAIPLSDQFTVTDRNLLGMPRQKIAYPDNGRVSGESGLLSVECDFEDVDPEEYTMLLEIQAHFSLLSSKIDDVFHWRRINSVHFSCAGDHPAQLDFAELIPEGMDLEIYFNSQPPHALLRLASASFGEMENGPAIFINSAQPVNLEFYLLLLHEMGHANAVTHDYTNGTSRDAFNMAVRKNEPIEELDLETVLREERDAWAFALAKLRPFLRSEDSPLTRKTVINYIHNVGLRSYSVAMRTVIEKGLVKQVEAMNQESDSGSENVGWDNIDEGKEELSS